MTTVRLPPRAPRGEVSAQRTEGSWGAASFQAPVDLVSVEGLIDRFQHDAGTDENVMIPEAQDAKAAGPQERISARVRVRLFDVLAAVELDDDEAVQAGEVADVRSNGMLAAKFVSGQLPSTQTLPQDPLCVGRAFAKIASVTKHEALHHPMRA